MKTILIYSGKGGVGKSTITGKLAKLLAKKYKTCVIDGDITTPSMHLLLDESNKNLSVFSVGYTNPNGLLEFQENGAKFILEKYKKEINKDTDFVLIDTPPGIGGIHNAITKVFNIDGVVMISQCNELSLSKVRRTRDYFLARNISVFGTIFNMSESCNENGISIIGYCKNIDDALFERELSPVIKLLENVKEGEWSEGITEIKNRFSTVTRDDIANMLIDKSTRNNEVLRFYNLETWDYVCGWAGKTETDLGFNQNNKFLTYNTTSTIKRLLDIFNDSDTNFVTILRPPMTEISLFGGEVGVAKLVTDKISYYGVPRVIYFTDEGEVTLFPHEVSGISPEDFEFMIKDKELIRHPNSRHERYIPVEDVFFQIHNAFGDKVSGNVDAYMKIFA